MGERYLHELERIRIPKGLTYLDHLTSGYLLSKNNSGGRLGIFANLYAFREFREAAKMAPTFKEMREAKIQAFAVLLRAGTAAYNEAFLISTSGARKSEIELAAELFEAAHRCFRVAENHAYSFRLSTSSKHEARKRRKQAERFILRK